MRNPVVGSAAARQGGLCARRVTGKPFLGPLVPRGRSRRGAPVLFRRDWRHHPRSALGDVDVPVHKTGMEVVGRLLAAGGDILTKRPAGPGAVPTCW